ncbi:hypothetical protein TRICI_003155 [Trichomonascus ciferrii]|uniref:Uncharacterized protein n=1 Tax=Trichomonascus ciferrii TaxID=44093 RepID=A0A642V5U2_9ASCO|nr:hypothetical protein TRICI_003155 [Trichomonascus ciferrii]
MISFNGQMVTRHQPPSGFASQFDRSQVICTTKYFCFYQAPHEVAMSGGHEEQCTPFAIELTNSWRESPKLPKIFADYMVPRRAAVFGPVLNELKTPHSEPTWGHAPKPPGLASLEAIGNVLFFLFVGASQSHGGAGGWPPAKPNPGVVFWGHAPRPPGLASLEAMGMLFDEASQSHGGAGGWPPAILPHKCYIWGHAPRPPGLASLEAMGIMFVSFYSLKPRRATGVQGAGPLQNLTQN